MTATQSRPLIGILLDYQPSGSFSSRPHYALRTGYFDAVWRAGGLPMALSYLAEADEAYLARLDGLVLPGGFYPFPARLYDEKAPAGESVHPRYAFEERFTRLAMDADKPMLGICAGMQVMAAATGATLYRDVRKELPTEIDHLDGKPAEEAAHGVAIAPDSLLARTLGVTAMQVNTAHREALKDGFDNLIVSACAPDGVVEGIELGGHRYCLGVQWHPEFFAAEGDPNLKLFSRLVEAAGG
ncbi:MAG: gamma-glutamyl-gamma-aminobutyrate hydrolase family protein [Rhodospirillaceae bacterium]